MSYNGLSLRVFDFFLIEMRGGFPQPFNRRCRIYSGFFILLFAHSVPLFQHVKDKM